MEEREFEKLVAAGIDMLPDHIREKVQNVAVLVEDEPSEEVRQEEGLRPGETLLGLYTGIPLSERGSEYGVGPTLPDSITIYRLPILEAAYLRRGFGRQAAGDPERIKQEVCDTVWHEFAHHFGFDEPEVREKEAKKISKY